MIICVNRRILAASVALALCVGYLPQAFAAEPEVLFEDDFSELDPSFVSTSEGIKTSVDKGSLVIANQSTWYMRAFYQSTVFADADINIRIRLAAPDAEKGAYAGIAFWALNYDEYYAFAISDSNTVAVFSTNGKRTVMPVSWRRTSALKTEAGEWNDLRIITVGNWAMLYLNGKKLATIKGKPPEGGGIIGPVFAAGSEATSGEFSQLKVITPSGPDAVPPEETTPSDPNVLFSDDFAVFDPGWGTESGGATVKDNKFVIQPQPGYGYHLFNQAVLVTDMDMTSKVSVADNDPKSFSSAGIVFWAQADDDFFILQVADDGTVGVDRLLKGRWLTPIPYKAPPTTAKAQPGAASELRVVTNGKKATCYINGVSLGTITGQPIKGDWQFGMYAQCGTAQAVAEFSSLAVRKPAQPAK